MSNLPTNTTNAWFTKYCKNALSTLDELKKTRLESEDAIKQLKRTGTLDDGLYICPCCVKLLIKKYKYEGEEKYFEQLRVLSEMYYIIDQYIDSVLENSVSEAQRLGYMRLITVIYKKAQELQREICITLYKPSTFEKKEIYKTTFQQLCASEKLVSKYILKKDLYYKPKRDRKQVNYKL